MPTLNQPVRVTVDLHTTDDVIALALRLNLDPDNLSHWYHVVRDKPDRIIPDVRFTDLFKTLRNIMHEEGVEWDRKTAVEVNGGPDPDDDDEHNGEDDDAYYDYDSDNERADA